MGELFDENFYTTDFDKEMMDFIESKYKCGNLQWNYNGNELVYGSYGRFFWTNSFPANSSITEYQEARELTKQQFKDKIGMVDKVEKQDEMVSYKLIDKEGYLNSYPTNTDILKEVGSYLFQGSLDKQGYLVKSGVICITNSEFRFFEKVDNNTPAEPITEPVTESDDESGILSNQYIIDKCKNTNTNLVITGEGVYILDCVNSIEYRAESLDDYEGIINAIELLQRKEVGVD